MSLKHRVMIAAALAAAIGAFANGASAVSKDLSFTPKTLSDPEVVELWGDLIEDSRSMGADGAAYISRVDLSDGRRLTVTQFWTPYACGALDCPTRVFDGKRKLVDGFACSWLDEYRLTDDGKDVEACEDRLEIPATGSAR